MHLGFCWTLGDPSDSGMCPVLLDPAIWIRRQRVAVTVPAWASCRFRCELHFCPFPTVELEKGNAYVHLIKLL